MTKDALRHQFDVTSGISGELFAATIAALCMVLAATWVSWVSVASLRDLREQMASVHEVLARIAWSGFVFVVVVALLAYVG